MSRVVSWIDIVNDIKTKNISNTKATLNYALVTGFINDIDNILEQNTIIPTDIIKLIILFCSGSTSKKLFIKQKHTELCILNIDDTKISKLVEYGSISHPGLSNHFSFAFAFVYNIKISHHQNGRRTTKLYDGVICIERDHQYDAKRLSVTQYPSIYLFESNKIEDDIIYYYRCRATKENWIESNFLFCGQNNGIVYESYGNLYQSKLENIDFVAMDFNFNIIETQNIWQSDICNTFDPDTADYVDWENYSDSIKPIKLRMIYLENSRKIFAMETEDDYNGIQEAKKYIKCGIFDFKQLKWHKIANLVKNNATYCQRGVCYNPFDEDIIFTVDDKGQISQYNLSKNEWNMFNMSNSLKLKGDIVCWMNHNKYTLYCSDGNYFGYLDIRDKERKWRKMDEIMDVANVCGPNSTIFM